MLSAGTRLGAYEILAPLGAGGMGEVLRARDTRIGREVAIKLLPVDVAKDPERLRRFEVEARAAGSLNHPNLVTIHEFGVENGTPYLVMELLEGDTLREKLGDTAADVTRARLPIRKALDFSQQLATGLAAAHEKGIVHRDLKPDNIFITRDGRLKILDFGLAKLTGHESDEHDATQARDTSPGTILGTPGYMSPEQVRGQSTDQRTDIFSFGAILYEMLSGQRAFRGASAADTMSAILHDDPAETSGSSHQQIPPGVDRVVRRCLEKEKSQRFESARDLGFALDAVTSSGISHERFAAAEAPSRRSLAMTAIGAALLLLAGIASYVAYRMGRASVTPPQQSVTQLTFAGGIESAPAMAPDGKTFVFVTGEAPNRRLFLQRVDGRSAISLSKNDDDFDPAFSPDGNEIAFASTRDGGGIFVMGATGESVRRLTSYGYAPSWSPDGKEIVFSTESIDSPTSRSSVASIAVLNVASGAIRKLGTLDAVQPSFSPHGKRIVYWGLPPTGGQRDIRTIDVSGDPKTVVKATDDAPLDWNPVWAPDGKSIFFSSDRGGSMNLWRLPIDESSGKPAGEPQAMPVPATWGGWISIARDGRHLLYAARSSTDIMVHGTFDPATEKVTLDSAPVLSGSMLVRDSDVSPDGQWIAFTNEGRQEDVYAMRVDGSELRQLTDDLARDRGVSWAPDSRSVVFYSSRGGDYDAWTVKTDGSGLRQLTQGAGANFPILSPDARRIVFYDLSGDDANHARIAVLGAKPVTEFTTLPPIPGVNDAFFAAAWSADGTKLIGTTWRTRVGLYVYSLADKSYRTITQNRMSGVAGATVPDVQGTTAPIDDHRLLTSIDDENVAIADLTTNTLHTIAHAPRVTLSRDARNFLSTARHTESDIWQLTLGEDPK